MRIRFEFKIEPRGTEDIDAADVAECESIEDLKETILDWPDPDWRVYVNEDDLAKLWAEVEKLRDRER